LPPLIQNIIAHTPKKSAETDIYLSLSSEAKPHTGLYYKGKKPVKVSALAKQKSTQEWLWEKADELTNFHR